MKRKLEPELMEDAEQVNVYAKADFSAPHNAFIEHLKSVIDNPEFCQTALDLGCGPGDITQRFARAFPLSQVHALDGSAAMLDYAKANLPEDLTDRLSFFHHRLPNVQLPDASYPVIYSNSLLHHLPNPQTLWDTVRQFSSCGTRIVIMDLLRPRSVDDAQNLVTTYASQEPAILQHDFYHSLLAAFTLDEIQEQLKQAKLPFQSEQISDRHVLITGIMP